jgi:hypothetical protein
MLSTTEHEVVACVEAPDQGAPGARRLTKPDSAKRESDQNENENAAPFEIVGVGLKGPGSGL